MPSEQEWRKYFSDRRTNSKASFWTPASDESFKQETQFLFLKGFFDADLSGILAAQVLPLTRFSGGREVRAVWYAAQYGIGALKYAYNRILGVKNVETKERIIFPAENANPINPERYALRTMRDLRKLKRELGHIRKALGDTLPKPPPGSGGSDSSDDDGDGGDLAQFLRQGFQYLTNVVLAALALYQSAGAFGFQRGERITEPGSERTLSELQMFNYDNLGPSSNEVTAIQPTDVQRFQQFTIFLESLSAFFRDLGNTRTLVFSFLNENERATVERLLSEDLQNTTTRLTEDTNAIRNTGDIPNDDYNVTISLPQILQIVVLSSGFTQFTLDLQGRDGIPAPLAALLAVVGSYINFFPATLEQNNTLQLPTQAPIGRDSDGIITTPKGYQYVPSYKTYRKYLVYLMLKAAEESKGDFEKTSKRIEQIVYQAYIYELISLYRYLYE